MEVTALSDVVDACRKQKCRKAPGPDGITIEAVIYGGHRLCVQLCLLYNLFIKYGFLLIRSSS